MSKKLLTLISVVLMLSVAISGEALSQARDIPVVNYSFEIDNDGCQVTEHTGDLGIGWEIFGKWMGQDVLCDDPDPYDYYSYFCKPWPATDGTVMAYMQTNDIYCLQILDEIIAPQTMYTLTIDALTFDPDVFLTASLICCQKDSNTPIEITNKMIYLPQIKTYDQSLAEWSEYSVSLVVPENEEAVGRRLGIKFFAHTGEDNWRWIFLDNIRVQAKIATDAYNPLPPDKAINVDPFLDPLPLNQLGWSPGLWALEHDVYFGTDFEDVSTADTTSVEVYKGRQPLDVNSYAPGFELAMGQKYYWRVDEVNSAHPDGIWKGPVWSFKVNDGKAFDPSPQYGAEGIDPNVMLSWSPGLLAASYDVYLGTDFEEVTNADTSSDTYKGTVDVNSYMLEENLSGGHYHWRIDSVNDTHPDYLWKGETWSFAVPTIIYVDADATASNDGSSWTNAFNSLQDAIADAKKQDEIRVAEGIYKPDQGGGNIPGNRKEAFFLKEKVAIKGGYAGFGQSDPDARDIQLYETVLSGDLNGNDWDNIPIQDLLSHISRAENSLHVVAAVNPNIGWTTVLDGVTVTAGNANLPVLPAENWPHFYGGGVYCNNWASPIITNCKITNSSAERDGGGARAVNTCSRIVGCTFTGNLARSGAGLDLGTKHFENGEPVVSNCTFTDNMAVHTGGGIMTHSFSDAIIINCLVARNSAGSNGGGIVCFYSGEPIIINCTIADNISFSKAGGIASLDYGVTTITNCIIWGNQASNYAPQLGLGYENTAVVSYCDVQGGSSDVYVALGCILDWGKENITANPLFLDPLTGDYHLDYLSPCIDAGRPGNYREQTDIDGDPRVIGKRVDIGADEFSGM